MIDDGCWYDRSDIGCGYGQKITPYKEAIHKAIVNKEYSPIFLEITGGIIPFNAESALDRRKEWLAFSKGLPRKFHEIEPLECTSNLIRMQGVERIEALITPKPLPIETLTRGYRDYTYTPGDVVYCDIPYSKTYCGGYSGFDHSTFWDWARTIPCYVSEYTAPDDFECVWQKAIPVLMSTAKTKKATEKLFKSPALFSV